MELEYKGVHIDTCPNVYEPAEDTFLLMDSLVINPSDTVLEIGPGTGIISIYVAGTASHVTCVDINPHAVECTKKNSKKNKITNIDIIEGNLFSGIEKKYDVVIFNTPYVPTEDGEDKHTGSDPELARSWDGGSTGRKVIDRFLEGLQSHTNPQSRIYMVESSRSEYRRSIAFLESHGYSASVINKARFFFDEIVVIFAQKKA